MIVLPSIAFGGFSGSAKDVTARQVGGRTILGVRTWPTGPSTNAQIARRSSMAKITKSYKLLTDVEMRSWARLAEHASGAVVLGQKAELSGMNLYVRLNANRAMAGEPLLKEAPSATVNVPEVAYSEVAVTPEMVVISGIEHQSLPFKLVVKMSGSQSAGISSGWSKTVIISSDVQDVWGEADVTTLYLKTIGVEPVVGQKVFVEAYWLDTSTGFTGQVRQDVAVVTGEAPRAKRVKVTMNNLDPEEESNVSSLNVDFSTGAPVAVFEAMCENKQGYAWSEVHLNGKLPDEVMGTGMCLSRSCDAEGHINVQSTLVYMNNWRGKTTIEFAHRGGLYCTPCEAFGGGIIYQ